MPKSRKVLLSIAVLLIFSLACSFITGLFESEPEVGTAPGEAEPTEAPATEPPPASPTPEPEEQADEDAPRRRTVAATPTPFHLLDPENDVRAILDLASPDYFDYFDEVGTWFDFDNEGIIQYRYEDGHLLGTDFDPADNAWWWSYANRSSGNTYGEITVTNGDCIDKDSVGFVIRVDESSAAGGYGLEVSCDGNWRFLMYRIGKAPSEMVEWTPSEHIETGPFAVNRLGLYGYQGRFVMFINGVQVGEDFDGDYPFAFGKFAVYVKAYLTYDLTAEFDDFAMWHVPFIP